MFCPSCENYLTETQLIKTNLMQDTNTVFGYDANCPLCEQYIGKMFWGKLTVAEEFAKQSNDVGEGEISQAEETIKSNHPPYPPPSYYYCPHCNQPLPEDKDEIPYKAEG